MAGRVTGLTEDKIAHVGDDPLPEGLYDELEDAVVRYAQRATAMAPIDDALYAALRRHLSEQQVVELCFTVGMANMVNRFHATFHTDVDELTRQRLGEACPVLLPPPPGPA